MSHTFEPILILIYGVDQVNILSTCCSLFLKELRVFFEWASLVAQTVKNLPAIWEIRVQSLGQEDPLEKGMATHSSILAWRIPWTEEPGELQSRDCRVRQD